MVPMKSAAAARGSLIFLALVTSIVRPENASAAQTTRTEVLSVGVAKPLMAAQVAIRQNHWDAALESIKQAQNRGPLDRQGRVQHRCASWLRLIQAKQIQTSRSSL